MNTSSGRHRRAPSSAAVSDAAALTIGSVLSGLAAYAYAAIGSRSLGADGFAPVAVLWAFWALTAAAVSFPVQHWVIRSIRAAGNEGEVRNALPRVLLIASLCSLAVGIVAWSARARLFGSTGVVFPISLAVIPMGSVLVGLSRGTLAARHRFVATSAAFTTENLIRVILAVVGAQLGWTPAAFGMILIAGFASVLFWPDALWFRRAGPDSADLALLGATATGSALSQFVLTGGPIAASVVGATPAEVTALFAALALFRAPYVIALGIASRLTGTLTSLVMDARSDMLRRVLLATSVLVGSGAAAAVLFATTIGPMTLRLLFGSDVVLATGTMAVIGAGTAIAIGTLVHTLIVISRARSDLMIWSWVTALASSIAWIALGPGSALTRIAWAFLIGEATALAVMTVAELHAGRGPARLPVRGVLEAEETFLGEA